MEVPVELPGPRFVVPLEEDGYTTEGPNQVKRELAQSTSAVDLVEHADISLSTLPPLLLEIIIPPTYPLHVPPEIISLHATHGWLARKFIPLRQLLLDMWHPGDGVLYNWIEWLRSGEFLDALHLLGSSGGKDMVRYVRSKLTHNLYRDSLSIEYRIPPCK